MAETKMAPKMAKSAGCGSCGTFFLFCFVLLLAALATSDDEQANAAVGRSRPLAVGLPTGATIASRLSTSVWQHCALVHGAMLPEPFVPASRTPPNDVCFVKGVAGRGNTEKQRSSSTTSIHPASVVVGTTQEMQRKIPLRHLSKVSM
ncbi:hypothetical protein MTO96_002262 [Rhipicephalus appendiculatus]